MVAVRRVPWCSRCMELPGLRSLDEGTDTEHSVEKVTSFGKCCEKVNLQERFLREPVATPWAAM